MNVRDGQTVYLRPSDPINDPIKIPCRVRSRGEVRFDLDGTEHVVFGFQDDIWSCVGGRMVYSSLPVCLYDMSRECECERMEAPYMKRCRRLRQMAVTECARTMGTDDLIEVLNETSPYDPKGGDMYMCFRASMKEAVGEGGGLDHIRDEVSRIEKRSGRPILSPIFSDFIGPMTDAFGKSDCIAFFFNDSMDGLRMSPCGERDVRRHITSNHRLLMANYMRVFDDALGNTILKI